MAAACLIHFNLKIFFIMKLLRVNTILAGLLGALIFVGCKNSKSNGQTKTISTSNKKDQITDVAKSRNGKPTVVLTEYADFQCPTCKLFSPIVKKLKKTYGDTLIVRFRYFPLSQHQYSRLAARAAQAAKNQGKFEAMHDLLFKNQKKWENARNAQKVFAGYAKKIGLNMKQFKSDLNSSKTEKIVMEQKKKGEKLGVNSTPTFFINDEEMTSLPRGYKSFKALLDIYVHEAKKAANNS
jgi:protein-disulfide isomerase